MLNQTQFSTKIQICRRARTRTETRHMQIPCGDFDIERPYERYRVRQTNGGGQNQAAPQGEDRIADPTTILLNSDMKGRGDRRVSCLPMVGTAPALWQSATKRHSQ